MERGNVVVKVDESATARRTFGSLPFALGAGLTAGPEVIERVGVGLPEGSYKDLFNPLRPLNKPALLKLIESGGR